MLADSRQLEPPDIGAYQQRVDSYSVWITRIDRAAPAFAPVAAFIAGFALIRSDLDTPWLALAVVVLAWLLWLTRTYLAMLRAEAEDALHARCSEHLHSVLGARAHER